VKDRSLRSVVSDLQLGEVLDVTTHACGGNKAAVSVVLERLAVEASLLLSLSSEDLTSGNGAVPDTIDIDSHDLVVVRELTLEHWSLGPWNTGVRHEDVETAVELLDNLVGEILLGLCICHITWVCLACEMIRQHRSRLEAERKLRTLDAELLLDLSGLGLGLLVAVVPYCNIGTGLGEHSCNGKTNTCTRTSDNGSLALQVEELQDSLSIGGSSVVLAELGLVLGVQSAVHFVEAVIQRMQSMLLCTDNMVRMQ